MRNVRLRAHQMTNFLRVNLLPQLKMYNSSSLRKGFVGVYPQDMPANLCPVSLLHSISILIWSTKGTPNYSRLCGCLSVWPCHCDSKCQFVVDSFFFVFNFKFNVSPGNYVRCLGTNIFVPPSPRYVYARFPFHKLVPDLRKTE